MGIIYLMLKYKWCLPRCLEFMNSKKSDIEITKQILCDLKILEAKIQRALSKKDTTMRQDWEITMKSNIDDKQYQKENDEATLINQYLNSLKPSKEDKEKEKELNTVKESATEPPKIPNKRQSMKFLIAETLKETENKRDNPKRKLNWSYLEKNYERVQEKEKSQVKAFKKNHFSRKKNVLIEVSSTDSKHSDEGLSVVKEHTYEETKSSGTYKKHLNIIKK